MRGTTQALRLLFGRGVGEDYASEFLDLGDGQPAHLFDCFALLNSMLCSAVRPGSRNGQSTRTMRENCLRHLRAALKVLEPTVVVVQGAGVTAWIAELFDVRQQVSETVAEVELAGRRMALCSFTHPAAHGRHNWGNSVDAPYLRLVVEDGIAKARRFVP